MPLPFHLAVLKLVSEFRTKELCTQSGEGELVRLSPGSPGRVDLLL